MRRPAKAPVGPPILVGKGSLNDPISIPDEPNDNQDDTVRASPTSMQRFVTHAMTSSGPNAGTVRTRKADTCSLLLCIGQRANSKALLIISDADRGIEYRNFAHETLQNLAGYLCCNMDAKLDLMNAVWIFVTVSKSRDVARDSYGACVKVPDQRRGSEKQYSGILDRGPNCLITRYSDAAPIWFRELLNQLAPGGGGGLCGCQRV